jgi:hypothetical protein
MKNKIKKIIKRNYTFISIILWFILCAQSHAQWQKLNLPDSVRVNSLAVIDSNIFAGTDGDGIFLSTDNGKNWEGINDGLQSKVIHKIFIDGITIFAGTDSGAYISTDNGFNWNAINSGLSGLGVWSFAVGKSIFGDSTYLAGTWNGIYSSTDRGKNWKATGLSNTTMPVHSIIVKDNLIFAATLGGGVFKSQDNGFTWSNISILDTNYFGVTALVPVYSLTSLDTNIIAAAGPGYFYFTSFAAGNFVHTFSSSKYMPILCFAMQYAKLFAGNSSGNIFLSNNSGTIWYSLSPSLKNQVIYSLALNDTYIFAGTGDGVWRLRYPETTTNVNDPEKVPTGFALEQNYPNPFNPTTTIKYSIPQPTVGNENFRSIQLIVYDVLGRVVAVLVNEEKSAGTYEVTWNAANLPSGMYFYQLKAFNPKSGSGQVFTATKKLLLLK